MRRHHAVTRARVAPRPICIARAVHPGVSGHAGAGLSVPMPASVASGVAVGWESVAQRPGKQGGRGVPASPRQGRCYGRRSRRSKDELGPGIPKTDRQLWPAPQRMPGWRALNSVGTDYASRRRLCERPVSLTITDLANHLHKLVVPWLLICPPVWAAKLPVPPVPPPRPPPGQSRAGSTPRITRTNQSCFVSANANPASSAGQHSADQTSSRA